MGHNSAELGTTELHPALVGATRDLGVHSWEVADTLLYALAVGAGDRGDKGLQFTTENTTDHPHRVLPTYALVPATRAVLAFEQLPLARLLHAEQSLTLRGPLPPRGELHHIAEITEVIDKGRDALVRVRSSLRDHKSGDIVAVATNTVWVRGGGGFGGRPGSIRGRTAPHRNPDAVLVYQTRPDQALLYRLTGDLNPLHSDPVVARQAGFDRPILHGLCAFGFAVRAILESGVDVAEFASVSARFAAPVFPGDDLTVRVWREPLGGVLFDVFSRGRLVITRGVYDPA